MNMFRRDNGSPAQSPVVPPRPTKEELDNAVRHSHKTQDPESNAALKQKTGVMGVVQKATSSSSNVSQTSSSESLEQATDSTKSPGMFKGAIQKVNPFKSSAQQPKNDSQGDPANTQEPDKDLQDKRVSCILSRLFQTTCLCRGVMSSMIQKVNPFKSSQPKDTRSLHSDASSSSGSLTDNSNVPEKQVGAKN
ncbi:hypothetical protein CCH79_00019264, partial [Gambusia affinis]